MAFFSPARLGALSLATFLHVAGSPLQPALAQPLSFRGRKGTGRTGGGRSGRRFGFIAFWILRDPALLAPGLWNPRHQCTRRPTGSIAKPDQLPVFPQPSDRRAVVCLRKRLDSDATLRSEERR